MSGANGKVVPLRDSDRTPKMIVDEFVEDLERMTAVMLLGRLKNGRVVCVWKGSGEHLLAFATEARANAEMVFLDEQEALPIDDDDKA